MSALPSEDELRGDINKLQVGILKMHTEAWKFRMKQDLAAMKRVHGAIRAYKKKIKDCQWMMNYVQAGI